MRRLVVLAGAVLLIAGCGQSDEGAANPTSTPAVPSTGPVAPSTELGSCMVGTWDLDIDFYESMLLESTRASMERDQLGGTIASNGFSATQTTTFESDGTFTTQVSLSLDMMMEVTDFEGVALPSESSGYEIPATYDTAITATGTWTAEADSFVTTVDDTAIDETMTVGGEPVAGPGGLPVLLPDVSTPATCSASTLIIPVGDQDAIPAFPDELIFSRHE